MIRGRRPFVFDRDVSPRKYASWWQQRALLVALSSFVMTISTQALCKDEDAVAIDVETGVAIESNQSFLNWSGTHACHPQYIFYPKSSQEIARVLTAHSKSGAKIRPIGTALSPNGIGLSSPKKGSSQNENLLSLSALDYIHGSM